MQNFDEEDNVRRQDAFSFMAPVWIIVVTPALIGYFAVSEHASFSVWLFISAAFVPSMYGLLLYFSFWVWGAVFSWQRARKTSLAVMSLTSIPTSAFPVLIFPMYVMSCTGPKLLDVPLASIVAFKEIIELYILTFIPFFLAAFLGIKEEKRRRGKEPGE